MLEHLLLHQTSSTRFSSDIAVAVLISATYTQEHTELAVTSLTVHRLVICAVLLAVKMTDDRYFNNAFFAKIGGIDLSELNTIELKMLQLLDYRTHVSTAELRWLLLRLKSFDSVGQINSVLCKKRSSASVDLPTAAPTKHRDVGPDAARPHTAIIRQTVEMAISRSSLTCRSSSCRLRASSCSNAAIAGELTRSPSNGFCLPHLPPVSDLQTCSQQESSVAAPVPVGVVEVLA